MTGEVSNVNWLTLVMSSAVVSAGFNIVWSACSKLIDHKKEAAKDAKRIGHVYLDIALQLETFAQRCDARLFDIDHGMAERGNNHDESYLSKLKALPFCFEPEPNWSELPVSFVARHKVLPSQYAVTGGWISEQWEYWADLEDVYLLEQQCLAYYGLKVCTVAAGIRKQIGVADAENTAQVEHFRSEIQGRREGFRRNPQNINLIPELSAMFASETSASKLDGESQPMQR